MPNRRNEFLTKGITLEDNQRQYWYLMINEIAAMLDYPPLREHGIDVETLVEYALVTGCAGVRYDEAEGKWKCGKLRWSDIVDDNGIAKTCVLTGVDWSEECLTEDIAYMRNYHTQNTEKRVQWFADMFAEIDNAQECLIENTKYTPVPVASNSLEKTEYENVLRRKQAGEKITVMLRPAANPLIQRQGTNQDENARVLNLTDPTMIEKMHYLSEYHSEIKKRFATMYGMCFKSSSKSAQETVDEVHGMDNFSLIIPHLRKKYMEEFAEQCKKLWGWAGKEAVKFTELWQREDEAAEEASEPEEERLEENKESEEGGEENESIQNQGDTDGST